MGSNHMEFTKLPRKILIPISKLGVTKILNGSGKMVSLHAHSQLQITAFSYGLRSRAIKNGKVIEHNIKKL